MGAVLDRLALDDAPPPGLEIAAVRDEAALRAWAQVVEPAEPRARAVEVLASLGLGPDAPLQHRLARRDGAIVGAASFLLHGDTVLGQQLASSRPSAAAGIGRALVQACAREALTAGARVAVVGPTPETVAFYRLLGFALRAVAARPLVLPAAAPRVTRRGSVVWVVWVPWARSRRRAGPVGGSRSSDSAGSV